MHELHVGKLEHRLAGVGDEAVVGFATKLGLGWWNRRRWRQAADPKFVKLMLASILTRASRVERDELSQ